MEENHIIALQTPPEKNYAVSLRKIEELLDRKSNGLTIGQIAKQIGTNRNSVAKYLEILLITGKVELRTVGPAKLYLPAKRIPLTSILEFTPSLIAVLDSQLRLAQANGPLLTFAGKRAEDVLGMDVRHVELPPLTSEYMLAHVGEALNGSPFKASITATKEGKQHQFEARLTPAVIEGGQRTLICIFEDVTEQRQTAQSAHLLTAIFASSSDAIVSMSLDGTITSWNAAAKRIYGYTPGEIIGKSLKTLYPPEGENETTLLLERAHDEMRMFPFETVRVRKDGVRISVSATLSPVWNAEGKMIGISSVSRDITERKKTEEALRKSDERFRAIVDTSPNGIALVEPDLTFTFVNTKMLEMLGYRAAEELIGKSALAFVAPEERQKAQENMHGLFKSKPPHVGLQYTLVRKDGTHIKVDASSSVLLDASGSPEALVCVVRENAPEKAPKEEVVAGTRGR